MSPLLRLLLRILRGGAVGAAGLVAAFIGIELWQRWTPEGFSGMTRQDLSFMVVLVLLVVGALWLARSIERELNGRSGP